MGGRSLAAKFAENALRKRNIGDDQRSLRSHVDCNLLLQDTFEMAHTAAFLRRRKSGGLDHNSTIRGDQHILHVGRSDIWIVDLKLVDRFIYGIGDVGVVSVNYQCSVHCLRICQVRGRRFSVGDAHRFDRDLRRASFASVHTFCDFPGSRLVG